MLWTIAFALAAPEGYSPTKSVHDCQLFLGPASGTRAIYAECLWQDVSYDRVDTLLTDWVGHRDVFSTIIESHEVRRDGERALIHQTHKNSGLSNRQVLLWMHKEPLEDGARWVWTMAETPPEIEKGNVLTAQNDGWWEVRRLENGLSVRYHLLYDPGGSVPGFVVRAFQTGGLANIVGELKAAAATTP